LTHRPPPNQRLVDYAFGLAWAVTRHFPEPVAERLLQGAADRVWKHGGSGVRQLEANLGRAVPGVSAPALRDLSHRAMRSYFRYWHEAFRLPSWSHRRIVDMVVTTNEAALREVHAQGRGAIVALPHMANWDLAGAWACLTGLPVSTVAERLRPESLYNRFVAYRAELGIEVEPLSGSGNPLTAMRNALERGRVVCLLADRSIGRGGVDVALLDETARLPGGVAALARMCKVPVVVATSSYRGPLMSLQISDPIEPVTGAGGVTATTQRIADEFSAAIRRTPQDWHMLQRIFVADLAATHSPDLPDAADTTAGGR
jgi:phosphatidylinositol dimannoside acyltransferase